MKMKYKEYEKAAKRHNVTCRFLIKKIYDPHEFDINPDDEAKLILNIYYLTGYIIENIISYSLFKVINYDKNKSVYDLDDKNRGIKFNTHFRKHSEGSNKAKIDFIRNFGGVISSSIPIIGDKKVAGELMEMYSKWDATIRYTDSHLGFEINRNKVNDFYKLALEIYTNLRKI